MAKVPLYTVEGAYVETLEIDAGAVAPAVNLDLIRRAILAYEANRRLGCADTKGRSEIAGSSHKPWRQKGTGRARSGHKRSPLWRGGGVVFGPGPRDFSQRLPVKARRNACASALRAKLEDGEVAIVEGFATTPAKTKTIASALKAMGRKPRMLLATAGLDETLWRCARNLPGVSVLPVDQVNAYHLARHNRVVLTREGYERLTKRVAVRAAEEVAP